MSLYVFSINVSAERIREDGRSEAELFPSGHRRAIRCGVEAASLLDALEELQEAVQEVVLARRLQRELDEEDDALSTSPEHA